MHLNNPSTAPISILLAGSLLLASQSTFAADAADAADAVFGKTLFHGNGSPSFMRVPKAIAKTDENKSWGERAKSVMIPLAKRYGLEDAERQLSVKRESKDRANNRHIHLQQRYKGIEVDGGEITVHFRKNRAATITGLTLRKLALNTDPNVSAEEASEIAMDHVGFNIARSAFSPSSAQSIDDLEIKNVRLVIYNKGAANGSWGKRHKLAYRITVKGPGVREFVYIDAQKGRVLDSFSGIHDIRDRNTYDALGREQYNGARLVRNESSGASGDTDVDNAHTYAGDTYDFFKNAYGRDSIDGKGMSILSFVHYGRGYQNAFWNGTAMTYGDGFPVDDVTAHEITHGVTENTAGLIYRKQSGALNESLSDIFGETVDQLNGKGTDTAALKWEMGEDVPDFGTLRDMANPPRFNNPDKVTSSHYYCGSQDNGGVHLNSGVPNKNYYLLVEGGTFNGRTVKGLGLTKAAAIHYHSLTNYLGKYSQFSSHFIGLWRACRDLRGATLNDPTTGQASNQVITDDDCNQVIQAGMAVEFFTRSCKLF